MHLVVSDYGVFLGKKSERLVLSSKGKTLEEIPLRDLEQVTIASSGVSVSTDAIAGCIEFGVQVNFLNSSGKPYALLVAPELNATVITRREQLKAYDDNRGVVLARAFVSGKVSNQAGLLRYFARHRKGSEDYSELIDGAASIEEFATQAEQVEGRHVDEIRATLMNLEGRAAGIYWEEVGKIAVGEGFVGREHRGTADPFNSALNYGYGVLYSQVWGSVMLAGLEPFAGFLHVDRPGKPSLVLDMVEEFRAPAVDRAVISLFTRGWRPEFAEDGGLTSESRREIAGAVLERLDAKERYKSDKHKLSGIILSQARRVAGFLRGEGQYTPYRAVW